MFKEIIETDQAPKAIGTYSQAIKIGQMVFLSGQIPLHPETGAVISEDIEKQIHQCFHNLKAVSIASGGQLDDIVKLTIYLTDLGHFQKVNQIMSEYFSEPYPARAVVGVKQLPKDVQIEMEGILYLI